MKAKQTTDLKHVEALRDYLEKLHSTYAS